LAASLRTIDEAQVAALAKLQSPTRGEFITDCARRLRAATDQPILETLTPALDHYWEAELKAQVAKSLKAQSIDLEEVFKEALALYQGSADKAQAAQLFQQAAELGHAGAQFYLGMSYENGSGVPKDVAAAANWFRQSATNGYVEASMALGYFYSEGLEVKPDYVEAFVWYSVAAAQGNRIGKLFRNGMMNKLNSGQLAEAEQRVAAIPIHQPSAASVAEPSSSGKDH
jgi:TPR repeat protein